MSATNNRADRIFDRSYYWFSACLLLLMVALLIGPRLPDDQQARKCVVNVHLPGPFGVSLHCDSPEYMRLAHEPSALLEPHNTRQSRPGLIFAAATLSWALSPLSGLSDKLGIRAKRNDIDPQRVANALANDIPAYFAYIILNVAILMAAFYFFRRICVPWTDNTTPAMIILTTIGLLLVTNDIVKAFVWSPQTGLFNIFVPIFALYASMRANGGALTSRRFTILFGAVTGLCGTAYPSFVIVLPCIAVCALIFAFRQGSRAIWSQTIVNIVVFAALTFAPEALWVGFVRLKTGGFYQHEMATYRDVLWMQDAWNKGLGTLATIWWAKLEMLSQFAALQAVPLAAVLIIVAAVALANRSTPATRPPLWPLVATSFLVSVVSAIFYTSVGSIVPRHGYSIILTLAVVAAACGLAVTRHSNKQRWILAYCCVAIIAAEVVYTVVKNGPYG